LLDEEHDIREARMEAYVGVGFHLHLLGQLGRDMRLMYGRRRCIHLLQILAPAASLCSLDDCILLRQKLFWCLRLSFLASVGGTL
jgi:hypothetical protein